MQLRLVLLDGARGRSFPLEVGQTLTLGGAPERDVCLPISHVEGWHWDVTRDGSGAWLRDRNSSSGCQLNGERVEPGGSRRMRPGDLLEIGDERLLLTARINVSPDWLRGNEGAARKLARAIAWGPDLAAMPVLADALEEAGCDDDDLLACCRAPGTDRCARWVLAVLLAALTGEG